MAHVPHLQVSTNGDHVQGVGVSFPPPTDPPPLYGNESRPFVTPCAPPPNLYEPSNGAPNNYRASSHYPTPSSPAPAPGASYPPPTQPSQPAYPAYPSGDAAAPSPVSPYPSVYPNNPAQPAPATSYTAPVAAKPSAAGLQFPSPYPGGSSADQFAGGPPVPSAPVIPAGEPDGQYPIVTPAAYLSAAAASLPYPPAQPQQTGAQYPSVSATYPSSSAVNKQETAFSTSGTPYPPQGAGAPPPYPSFGLHTDNKVAAPTAGYPGLSNASTVPPYPPPALPGVASSGAALPPGYPQAPSYPYGQQSQGASATVQSKPPPGYPKTSQNPSASPGAAPYLGFSGSAVESSAAHSHGAPPPAYSGHVAGGAPGAVNASAHGFGGPAVGSSSAAHSHGAPPAGYPGRVSGGTAPNYTPAPSPAGMSYGGVGGAPAASSSYTAGGGGMLSQALEVGLKLAGHKHGKPPGLGGFLGGKF
jgi:hypothetical protein